MNRQKRKSRRQDRAANTFSLRGAEDAIAVAFKCKTGREIARLVRTPAERERLLRRRDARLIQLPALL